MPTEKLSAEEKHLLETLGELGGQRVSQEDLRFEGNELILPATMSVDGAIEFLAEYKRAEEQTHAFSRTFNYRPWDGAHALMLALRELTGTMGLGKTIRTFFGDIHPEMRTINVGPSKTEQVPWGNLEVPLFKGVLTTTATVHPEMGTLFVLNVEAPKKYRSQIEGLFTLIESKLIEASIYKGKAIDGQDNAEFLDLSGVDPDKVIYTEHVRTQLEANVWSLLRHTDTMRRLGSPLKRSALLAGPYGTGKTLAGYLTAQIAVDNGWTCVYCRPERDDLLAVMQTARLYQPAVVFFEDVDTVADTEGDGGISRLLDVFDGIAAKGTELVAVMTTNHPERIHKGMIRPGRLDSVIEIGALDEGGVQEMIEKYVSADLREPDLDYHEIGEAMDQFLPAFIREALDRALRYGIARNDGEPGVLVTEDFVAAAEGLRPQLDLMEDAKEKTAKPTLDTAVATIVDKAMKGELQHVIDGAQLYSFRQQEVTHQVQANGG